jgi:hypothetical protein
LCPNVLRVRLSLSGTLRSDLPGVGDDSPVARLQPRLRGFARLINDV